MYVRLLYFMWETYPILLRLYFDIDSYTVKNKIKFEKRVCVVVTKNISYTIYTL